MTLIQRLQQGWNYLEGKVVSAYHAIKKRIKRTQLGEESFIPIPLAPLHSALSEKKDLSLFIIYADSALFHQNIDIAEWATYQILKQLRAPLLSDWPIPSGIDQLMQDMLFHRLSLQWASYYQQQGDIEQAINWYQVITSRHPEYYKKACYELGSIALVWAEELRTAILEGKAEAAEVKHYNERAHFYLTQAALLGDSDAQRLLERLANKTPPLLTTLAEPVAASAGEFYQSIENILKKGYQKFTDYFLFQRSIAMKIEKNSSGVLTEEITRTQSTIANDPVDIAKQQFEKAVDVTLSASLNSIDDIFNQADKNEKNKKSVFIQSLEREMFNYEMHLSRVKGSLINKYGRQLYKSIRAFIKELKPVVKEATNNKNEELIFNKLKELAKRDKNLGCYYHFLGFYSDPFSIKTFRVNLKNIAVSAYKNPLMLYQRSDKERLIELSNIKQKTHETVKKQHREMIENHKDSEDLLVANIKSLHSKIEEVKQKITDFESGEEYQRLRELPDKLKQDLFLQTQDFNQQIQLEKEGKAKLEQELNQRLLRQDQQIQLEKEGKVKLEQELNQKLQRYQEESKVELEQEIQKINQRLNVYKVYDKKLDAIRCPISSSRMKDPVLAEDGHTYERAQITTWLQDHDTSPLTRERIGRTLKPNFAVKKLINEYLEQRNKVRNTLFYQASSQSSYGFFNGNTGSTSASASEQTLSDKARNQYSYGYHGD